MQISQWIELSAADIETAQQVLAEKRLDAKTKRSAADAAKAEKTKETSEAKAAAKAR